MPRRQSSTPLLSPQDRKTCEAAAAGNIDVLSQRAHALLLIDEGKTHAETVQITGLTIGQVRYAINRYRKIGISMFPSTPAQEDPKKPIAEEPVKGKKINKKDKKKKDKKKKTSDKKNKKTKKSGGKNSKGKKKSGKKKK